MKEVAVISGFSGTPFRNALWDLFDSRALRDAVIASAFLDEPAADELLNMVMRAPRKAKITVLIGTMSGFTRKAALKKLIASKRLIVRQPLGHEWFHVKAACARVGTSYRAILGSHNLTAKGLGSEGELGIRIGGPPARLIWKQLQAEWVAGAKSWQDEIRFYRQSKRIPIGERIHVAKREKAGAPEYHDLAGSVAEEFLAMSKSDETITERLCEKDAKTHGIPRASSYVLCNSGDECPPGTIHDACLMPIGSSWGIGAPRGIRRILRNVRDSESNQVLEVGRWLIRYIVSPRSIAIAKKHQMYRRKARPSGRDLWEFESSLRRALKDKKIRGWS